MQLLLFTRWDFLSYKQLSDRKCSKLDAEKSIVALQILDPIILAIAPLRKGMLWYMFTENLGANDKMIYT